MEESTLKNFKEFSFANGLYWAIAEGYASEQAARRTAMENATKNANEMIQKLTLVYNRSRQASITNDLVSLFDLLLIIIRLTLLLVLVACNKKSFHLLLLLLVLDLSVFEFILSC